MRPSIATLLAAFAVCCSAAEKVQFLSADNETKLIGYVFRPVGRGPFPAVVMLHGRAGAYSSLADGRYTAETLSKRHKFWGEFWASRGYVALMVDSFGPRGYWKGFGKHSYEDRPSEVSEQTVRPLDAYGALAFLRKRRDIVPDRIGLQGWSNGGMTALVTMSSRAPGIASPTPESGFRAALAFYPGCGMEAIQKSYRNYAPIQMFIAGADEEVSPERCVKWEKKVKEAGGDIHLTEFADAVHNFDDPSKSKQEVPANARATRSAEKRAEEFFAKYLLQ